MVRYTFADFFAGIGLAQIGLEAAGWSAKFANDIDVRKLEMYRANFPDSSIYLIDNIHSIDASQIPEVTLWWASFPCTDVSLAGNRRGLAGRDSGALLGLFRLLDQKDGQRPSIVVLENVTGFLTSHGGKDFTVAIHELNRMGFSCDAFILNAINFVPQSRPRLFIIGILDGPATESVGTELARRDRRLVHQRLAGTMMADNGLRWTVLDIPPPPTLSGRSLSAILERLPDNSPRWWSEQRVEHLLSQMSDRHRQIADGLKAAATLQKATVFRRIRNGRTMAELRTDGIAGCLRTPRGGSSRQILLTADRGTMRARYMTPREYARLMGADDYEINTSDNRAYFGFGDAVCVPVVKWIGIEVLKPAVELLDGGR